MKIAVGRADDGQRRKVLLQAGGRGDLPRDADQRILRRQVAVARREQRRALHVRVVIGAARRDAHPADADPLEQREQRPRVRERGIEVLRAAVEETERGPVRLLGLLRNADAGLALLERHHVEGRQADDDAEVGDRGADAVDNRPQEARAVLERPAVASRTLAAAEQLVPEVAVAVLHVHEREPRVPRELRCVDESLDQPIEIVVAQHPHARRESRDRGSGARTR